MPPPHEPASRGSRSGAHGSGSDGRGSDGRVDRRRGDVGLGVRAWAGSEPAPPRADQVADGPNADAESVARTILLDQLAGRARSRRELADKLAAKGVADDLARGLLDRFEEVGLVDDEAFARTWVSQRQSGRGLAPRALAQELRRKGVADDVVREAVAEVGAEDQEAAARSLVRARLRSLSRVDDVTATRRLVGTLSLSESGKVEHSVPSLHKYSKNR